jgi:hypothetical protein
MRPPLRELTLGRDLARDAIPESEQAFLEALGGPALLRLAGQDPARTRIVSTLLHGNEPSGLRAVHGYLRSDAIPATDVLFFIGAVGTALAEPRFGHRALPGEIDANRCWRPPFESAPGRVAEQALARFRESGAECLVDLHNNTGHNPAYGVAFEIGHAEQSLVSLFADRVVHTPLELGTLVEATIRSFPSVTIECGRAGDPAADRVAAEGLERYLDWQTIDFTRPVVPLMILESPVRVCVREGLDLAFADAPDPAAPLTVSRSIDRHNFERMAPGSAIGWVGEGAPWPIAAVDADGLECSRHYFEISEGVLRTREAFIPIMMTTNREIAKSDCLFYAVQPAVAALPSG